MWNQRREQGLGGGGWRNAGIERDPDSDGRSWEEGGGGRGADVWQAEGEARIQASFSGNLSLGDLL